MRYGVVVTGASSGIGAAIARKLSAERMLAFGSVRRPEHGRRLEEHGVTPIMMDVTDRDSIARAVAAVEASLGDTPLLGLVNNAGIPVVGPLECIPLEEVRRAFDVNVLGALAATQAFLPLLRRARGRVVNISSISGRLALPFMGPYAASKFALEALSDSLRRELVPAGVSVTVIEPGSIRTPIWQKVLDLDFAYLRDTPYEGIIRRIQAETTASSARGLSPDRVAGAVARALTEDPPPIRVPVVRSRVRWRLRRWLPDRWMDRIIARRVWTADAQAATVR